MTGAIGPLVVDAWGENPTGCPVCGRDACEDHLPPKDQPVRDDDPLPTVSPAGFEAAEIEDAVDIAARGRVIEASGVPYVLDKIVPAYGMLGFHVAYTKVGKTTLAQQLGAHVAMGRPFLNQRTLARRVLVLAPEDPPEYTAWLARHLDVDRERMAFRCRPLVLTPDTLTTIVATIRDGHFGLVLISSWQAVVRGLLRDENDNAGAVQIVEDVKAATRASGVPWLIDAHSGKGEAQDDEADPSRAMRGASGAAGAADYTLSLRYGNGAFGTQRRLTGKGRFVSFSLLMDFDAASSTYTVLDAEKDAVRETTWRLICETGAVNGTLRSATEIARAIGIVQVGGKLNGAGRRRVADALRGRHDIGIVHEIRRGQKTVLYRRLVGGDDCA